MKPLLIQEQKQLTKTNSSLRHFTSLQSDFIGRFGREEIREMIADLKKGSELHYIARMYNAHDVFVDLLKITGPAEIKIVSYSITEFPLRILSQLQEKGIIKKLDLVLDFTVSRTPALKQFAEHFANRVKFTDVHSKIVLISNENWQITFISSANFTRNNRFENGIIYTSKLMHTQYSEWFENLFEDAVK